MHAVLQVTVVAACWLMTISFLSRCCVFQDMLCSFHSKLIYYDYDDMIYE